MPNMLENQDNLTLFRELDFLHERYAGSAFIFDLIGTEYYLVLFSVNDCPHWKRYSYPVTFEEVFETIPPDLKEKFLYHLNLFLE